MRVRVQVVPMRPVTPRAQEVWRMGKPNTRKCLDMSMIAAAMMVDNGTVDLVMKGGDRWRLMLDRQCHQLSYYGGIYYKPRKAGLICANRDQIHSRAGGSCRVQAIAPLFKMNQGARN